MDKKLRIRRGRKLPPKEGNTMTKKYYDIGSVTSCTMRTEDLIPAFVDELEWLIRQNGGNPKGEKWKELQAIKERMEKDNYYEGEDRDWDLDLLFDWLNEFAPPYFYFGANPGDGADFGFWVMEDIQEDFNGIKVTDLSEIPKRYRGEVLEVNDHGNMTLWYCNSTGKLTEVWSIV